MSQPRRREAFPLQVLRHGSRAFGGVTAAMRPPPDFLVIGTKRGGTTSFFFDLVDHPHHVHLFPPPVRGLKEDPTKGVHYFDSNFGRGERWYRSHLPTSLTRQVRARRLRGPVVTGEASPYYLFHPAAAGRAHGSVPDTKLVALLRDPVQRSYSHWKERRRGGAEPLDFAAALDAEPGRLAGERERLLNDPTYQSYAWEQQSYAAQSRYADSLRPWIELFGRDRLLVLASEDYYTDPVRTLAEVDKFLGIPPRTTASRTIRNAAPGEPIPAREESRLREELASSRVALVKLTGRDFPWD